MRLTQTKIRNLLKAGFLIFQIIDKKTFKKSYKSMLYFIEYDRSLYHKLRIGLDVYTNSLANL